MKPTREQLLELLRIVSATAPREIDCEEFVARAGAYVENVEKGRELPPELREVAQHVAICKPCCEELQALLESRRSS